MYALLFEFHLPPALSHRAEDGAAAIEDAASSEVSSFAATGRKHGRLVVATARGGFAFDQARAVGGLGVRWVRWQSIIAPALSANHNFSRVNISNRHVIGITTLETFSGSSMQQYL